MCWDTVQERNKPGLIPLSGVAPLYNGFIAGCDCGQLVQELIGLKRGFLSLVRLWACPAERGLLGRVSGVLGFGRVLGPSLVTSA